MQAPGTAPPTILEEAIRRTRRAFFYVGLFSLCLNVMMLMLPIYSLQVLDRVLSSHSMPTLFFLTLIAIIGFIFYAIFSAIRNYILASVGEWLEVKVAPELIAHSVERASLGATNSAGQYVRDLMMIKNFISGGGVNSLFDAPWSLLFILIIYMISPHQGLIAIFGVLILIFLGILTEMATKRPLNIAQHVSIKTVGMADAASRNAEAIEAMGMMPRILADWQENNARSLKMQRLAAGRNNLIQTFTRFLRMALQIAVIAMGAHLVIENEITVGGMIAGSILIARALAPFEASISVWKGFVSARDSYRRINMSIRSTPVLRGEMTLPEPKGMIAVENVFYKPLQGDKPIIRAVSFQVMPGESVGVIGPSAAGKSTLARLLAGILPPSHGAVRLDGAEIFKWKRSDVGRWIGYLPQSVDLFSGTIKDNIARMDKDATAESVIEAAQMAGSHEMILRLPKGYDTEYSLGMLTLSPGQKQRIGLARALYGLPKFVVLDEPNLNLDGEGERALTVALQNIKKKGITCIVIAHRPSVITQVDKVLVLRDGMIEQFGPRTQVLPKYTGAALKGPEKPATPPPGSTPPEGPKS